MSEGELRDQIAVNKYRAYEYAIRLLTEEGTRDELKIQAACGILEADVDEVVESARREGTLTD